MFSELTYQVVTLTHDMGTSSDIVVDWALDMMRLGYDDENLYILAGLTKPVVYYEMVDYLRAALKALHLPVLTGEDAVFSQSLTYILAISRRQDVKTHVKELKETYTRHFDASLYDMAEIYYAWDYLEEGNNLEPITFDFTLDNIEDYAVDTARKWLRHNLHRHKAIFGFDMPL